MNLAPTSKGTITKLEIEETAKTKKKYSRTFFDKRPRVITNAEWKKKNSTSNQ